MRSFWSGLNSGLLFVSLVAWIGGVIIFVSQFCKSMSNEEQIGIILVASFVILVFHSFWGMLVEMSKNVIASGRNSKEDRNDNKSLNKENRELQSEVDELHAQLKEMSVQLQLLRAGSGDSGEKFQKIDPARVITENSAASEPERKIEWYCDSCLYGNTAADSRCARCGKPRVPDDDGERIQRIIVCPVCEFQNDESVGFCGGCGYKLK